MTEQGDEPAAGDAGASAGQSGEFADLPPPPSTSDELVVPSSDPIVARPLLAIQEELVVQRASGDAARQIFEVLRSDIPIARISTGMVYGRLR